MIDKQLSQQAVREWKAIDKSFGSNQYVLTALRHENAISTSTENCSTPPSANLEQVLQQQSRWLLNLLISGKRCVAGSRGFDSRSKPGADQPRRCSRRLGREQLLEIRPDRTHLSWVSPMMRGNPRRNSGRRRERYHLHLPSRVRHRSGAGRWWCLQTRCGSRLRLDAGTVPIIVKSWSCCRSGCPNFSGVSHRPFRIFTPLSRTRVSQPYADRQVPAGSSSRKSASPPAGPSLPQ